MHGPLEDETLPGLFSTIALRRGGNQDEGTVLPRPSDRAADNEYSEAASDQ